MQAAPQAKRRKRRRRALNIPVVAGLVLLALLLAAGALLALGRGGSPMPEEALFLPAKGPLPQVELSRAEEREGEEFHYLLNRTPAFQGEALWGPVYLENCGVNGEYMQVTYLLEDGTELYVSPMLPPGHHLCMGCLEEPLAPGRYEATAEIAVYPTAEAENRLGCFEEAIEITVNQTK